MLTLSCWMVLTFWIWVSLRGPLCYFLNTRTNVQQICISLIRIRVIFRLNIELSQVQFHFCLLKVEAELNFIIWIQEDNTCAPPKCSVFNHIVFVPTYFLYRSSCIAINQNSSLQFLAILENGYLQWSISRSSSSIPSMAFSS